MKIITVCGMGVGTSLMVLINIKNLAKKHGYQIDGESCDLGSAKSKQCDLFVISRELADNFPTRGTKIVILDSLLDKRELENKILPIIQKFNREV